MAGDEEQAHAHHSAAMHAAADNQFWRSRTALLLAVHYWFVDQVAHALYAPTKDVCSPTRL